MTGIQRTEVLCTFSGLRKCFRRLSRITFRDFSRLPVALPRRNRRPEMPRVKRDGLILDGFDGGRCILVRGTALPETLERAREWAAEDGYVLTDPEAVRLQWIRAIPCPRGEHEHDGYPCDWGPGGVSYLPGRPGRGAFQGVATFVSLDRGCSPVWTAVTALEPGLLFAKSDRTCRARAIRTRERQGVGRGQRPATADHLGAVRTGEQRSPRNRGAVACREQMRSGNTNRTKGVLAPIATAESLGGRRQAVHQ